MTADGLDGLLAAAAIDSAVHELRPDSVALPVAGRPAVITAHRLLAASHA
jgi:hypothetical protein